MGCQMPLQVWGWAFPRGCGCGGDGLWMVGKNKMGHLILMIQLWKVDDQFGGCHTVVMRQ